MDIGLSGVRLALGVTVAAQFANGGGLAHDFETLSFKRRDQW